MARTSIQQINVSGWKYIVVPEDDFSDFTEAMMKELRRGAWERMGLAQQMVVREWKVTLSKVYPLIRPGSLGRRTADPAVRAIRKSKRAARDIRVPAPAGQPPGRIMGDFQRMCEVGTRSWNKAKTVLTGRVQNAHPAAGMFEFTGNPRLNIKPHPHYRPTIARIERELGDLLEGRNQDQSAAGAA